MRYSRARDVAWVTEGEPRTVYVSVMPSGRPLVLKGTAADIWLGVLELGERDLVVDDLAAAYAVDAALIEPQVDDFLAELVRSGLLAAEPVKEL
ncbi:MAG TPA: PqqD family peptide modification chaperone [Phycicoccus sp.]|jgi:hypothetical protein|nr:PqqD family peptide modification chaperone [Phycicoccus sp.]HRA43586.1 PqqD family peptide modification chaperone [Phycicoccus sp.]